MAPSVPKMQVSSERLSDKESWFLHSAASGQCDIWNKNYRYAEVLAFSNIVVKSHAFTVLSSSFPPLCQGEFKNKIFKHILDILRESGQF